MQEIRIKDNNGDWQLLDINEDVKIRVNKLSNNVGDPLSRKIDFSNTYSLPNTANNRILLGLDVLSMELASSGVNSKYNVQLFSNGNVVIKGFLLINNIDINSIKVNITSEDKDWIDFLSGLEFYRTSTNSAFTSNLTATDPDLSDYIALPQSIFQFATTTGAGGGWIPVEQIPNSDYYFALMPTNVTNWGDDFSRFITGNQDKITDPVTGENLILDAFPINYFNPWQSRPVYTVMGLLRYILGGAGLFFNDQTSILNNDTRDELLKARISLTSKELDKESGFVNDYGEIDVAGLNRLDLSVLSTTKSPMEILSSILKTFGLFIEVVNKFVRIYTIGDIVNQNIKDFSFNWIKNRETSIQPIESEIPSSRVKISFKESKQNTIAYVNYPSYQRQATSELELELNDVEDSKTAYFLFLPLDRRPWIWHTVGDEPVIFRYTRSSESTTINFGKVASNATATDPSEPEPIALFANTDYVSFFQCGQYLLPDFLLFNGIKQLIDTYVNSLQVKAYFKMSPFEFRNLRLSEPLRVDGLYDGLFIISEVSEYTDEHTPVQLTLININSAQWPTL